MKDILKLLLCFIIFMVPTHSMADDRTDVLNVISSFFHAMEMRDVGMSKKLLMPDGHYYSVAGRDGSSRLSKFSDYLETIPKENDLLQERLIKPSVKVNDHIAVVWSDYQFFINGKLSHCGVDVFNFLKTDQGWRIADSIFTVEVGQKCNHLEKWGKWKKDQYVIR